MGLLLSGEIPSSVMRSSSTGPALKILGLRNSVNLKVSLKAGPDLQVSVCLLLTTPLHIATGDLPWASLWVPNDLDTNQWNLPQACLAPILLSGHGGLRGDAVSWIR